LTQPEQIFLSSITKIINLKYQDRSKEWNLVVFGERSVIRLHPPTTWNSWYYQRKKRRNFELLNTGKSIEFQ